MPIGRPGRGLGSVALRLAILEVSPHRTILVQLDSDPLGGMSWGYRGLLYVWAPEDLARAGRFDAAWAMMQSQLD